MYKVHLIYEVVNGVENTRRRGGHALLLAPLVEREVLRDYSPEEGDNFFGFHNRLLKLLLGIIPQC